LWLFFRRFLNKINETEWNKYPILDLSITPKEGYEEIILLNHENIDVFCDFTNANIFSCKYDKECNDYIILSWSNGYNSKKASKIYNTTLYINYYKFDYVALFDILDSENERFLWKDEYEQYGNLDIILNIYYLFYKKIKI